MHREILIHDRPGWITVRLEFDNAGERIDPHIHCFAHAMEVESGAALADLDGERHVVSAGETLTVPAHVRHGIVPLKAGTVVACQHEIRKENGEHDPSAFSTDGIPLEWLQRLTPTWGPVNAR